MAFPGCRPGILAMGVAVALAGEIAAAVPPAPRSADRAQTVSPPRLFAVRPVSAAATAGTAASFYGLNFLAGSTVTIGGVPATGVTLADATRINASLPALTPGSVNDVVVTVPGSPAVTLRKAFFAQFLDVSPSYLFARSIEKLRRTGITTGCGAGIYCPGDPVTRAQMAVFILRGKHGSAYHPPPATGNVFTDVPKTMLFADWIEEFAAEKITTGCGVGIYCPNNHVTRGEMAVFLLRAKFGSSYSPPAPIGFFGDVTTTTPFAKWIEELAGRAISGGCGGGNYCPTGSTTRGEMSVFLTKTFAKSPQEEIADDLAAGGIDYETSLLYRLYALFWDPRLPARYQTAPTSGEDPGLFEEIELVFQDLSAGGQAAIAPFLARPDDPASPFGPASAMTLERRPADGAATSCQTTWVASSAPGSHFKLHLCASSDETADNALLSSVNTLADSLWTAMTKAPPNGMGEPLADCYPAEGGGQICPGGDGKIDVYLLDIGQCRERNGQCRAISGGAVATTISAPPEVGNGKSGYMLLSRARAAAGETLKTDFVHEFFHLLQFRHNRKAMGVDTGLKTDEGEKVIENAWYVESSATWAEWYYAPETASDEVHWRFADDYQPSHASLVAVYPSEHRYASYIWSFFSQQEKGSGTPVFQSWVDAEGATGPDGITDAVDQQLAFQTHFRDFAVRNWNKDLAGKPIPKLYKDLKATDGSSPPFPTDSPVVVNTGIINESTGKMELPVDVESLAAQYDLLQVTDAVKKLVLRFDSIPSAIDVDLLIQLASKDWQLRHVDDKSDPVVFCRTRDEERVEQIVVVLSDHDKTRGGSAGGQYEVEVKPSCCGEIASVTTFKAHVTAHFSFSDQANVGFEQDFTTGQIFDVSGTIGTDEYQPPGQYSLSDNAAGTASENDKVVSHAGSTTTTATQTGSGSVDGTTSISMNFDVEKCTFTFLVRVGLEVSNGMGNFPAFIGGISAKGSHSLTTVADKITGGASFPAHSENWTSTNTDKDAYIVGGLGSTWFLTPNGEDNAGSAQITWEFDPVPPIQPPQ